MRYTVLFTALALICASASASAQEGPAVEEEEPVGQTAESSVGQAGQRQTREEAAPNIKPLGRIANRIQNRVRSRIRNRIDRNYGPQADAASPFEVAGEQARTTARPDPR